MSGNSSRSVAEAKIHILYLVDRCPGVTYHQLMDGCMKSLYVDFFDFSAAYEELIAGNLMDRSGTAPGSGDALGSTDILTLTEGGKAVLSDIAGAINDKLRSSLDSIAAGLKTELEESRRITSSILQENGRFKVSLSYASDSGNIAVTAYADDADGADAIVRKWRRDCRSLTGEFLSHLTANS